MTETTTPAAVMAAAAGVVVAAAVGITRNKAAAVVGITRNKAAEGEETAARTNSMLHRADFITTVHLRSSG